VRESYFNERGFAVLDALDAIAAERDVAVATVALAWLREQPTVVSPIASATSPQQCSELMASAELTLTDAERERLSDASG
jgi:aryl-alcohol dehydrogenase (NADP+)